MGKFHFFHKLSKKDTKNIVKTNVVMATTATFGNNNISSHNKSMEEDSTDLVEAKGMLFKILLLLLLSRNTISYSSKFKIKTDCQSGLNLFILVSINLGNIYILIR